MSLVRAADHANVLHQTALRSLGLAGEVYLLLLLAVLIVCGGCRAHYIISICVANDHFSILNLLLSLLLQSCVMLLLNVILVAIEKFLNRVSSQQKKTFLLGFFALWVLVHVCVGQRGSRFYQKQGKTINKGQKQWSN